MKRLLNLFLRACPFLPTDVIYGKKDPIKLFGVLPRVKPLYGLKKDCIYNASNNCEDYGQP